MKSVKTTARQAGILYLLILITAPIALIYFPGVFLVRGDAGATARNIADAALTYRLWILLGLVDQILFLFLVWTLYDLFKDVDKKLAMLMVMLVSVVIAFQLVNLLNLMAPLVLLSGASFLSVFTRPQLDAVAFAFLRLRGNGMNIATAFWGLWLFPFGVLAIKSRFFPRVLGVLLIVGCFAYVAVSFTSLVFPAQSQIVNQVALPFYAVGELSMIIWLVVKGARVPQHSQEVTQ